MRSLWKKTPYRPLQVFELRPSDELYFFDLIYLPIRFPTIMPATFDLVTDFLRPNAKIVKYSESAEFLFAKHNRHIGRSLSVSAVLSAPRPAAHT